MTIRFPAALLTALFCAGTLAAGLPDHEVERLVSPVPADAASDKETPFGISITVLTASSLAPELTARLAEETIRLRPLPVSIVYRGLPVTAEDGRPGLFRHDKAESERRLAPLIERGLGAVVDPGVFRRAEKAVAEFDPNVRTLPLPAVLLTTTRGTEIVTGTVALRWAAGHALSRTADPVWRREAEAAFRSAGVSSIIEEVQ